ncbi:ATP-binding cassette domain-containing protein (plasmid) [Variovorax paradoxus]|nr:ATP-binding cassette domain-containing protein [Variovorax paradoxus]
MQAVGLGDQGENYPRQLAGGMAQRAALAQALPREPKLLMADEPFSALYAITRSGMQEILIQLVHLLHQWRPAAPW